MNDKKITSPIHSGCGINFAMATTILPSYRDCFQSRLRHESFNTTRREPHATSTPSRRRGSRAGFQLDQRRDRDRDRQSRFTVAKSPGQRFLMEQVKILKRGEVLPYENLDPIKTSLDMETIYNQVNLVDGSFAGNAFFTSPPPTSVPFPCFLDKSYNSNGIVATAGSRRLLRHSM